MTPPECSKSRLPDGWSTPEVVADVVVADGLTLHRAGVSSVAPTGEEITGSAASRDTSPEARSFFELMERAAIVHALHNRTARYDLFSLDGARIGECGADDVFPESDEPNRWRYARSNGVALHKDWTSAAEHALWELVERDRILRSWYGDLVPDEISLDLAAIGLARTESYEWRAYAFRDEAGGIAPGVHVVGVFGFPHASGVPLVLGYGARNDERAALEVAAREALQLLAFLWGEAVTTEAPPIGPTAMHHLERFQFAANHTLLRNWLAGAHRTFRGRVHDASAVSARQSIRFVDLTPEWMDDGMRVAKAYCPSATPLAFGDAPFASHLPIELRPHPIA